MNSTWLRITTALGTAVLVASGLAAPASAEVRVTTDPAGDGSNGAGGGRDHKWGDIGKVRVRNGPEAVRLKVRPAEGGELADFYDFWVDTDPDDEGPEFVATVSLEVLPRSGVARTERFGRFGETTCAVRTARREGQGIRVVLPRTCFDSPGAIRVSTQTSMEYENADWAPGRRTFGPWVRKG